MRRRRIGRLPPPLPRDPASRRKHALKFHWARAGRPVRGQWHAKKTCNVWVNGRPVPPPDWKNPGKSGKEVPLADEVYTRRKPTPVALKKGWNTVLVCAGRHFQWHFTFCPVDIGDGHAREVPGLVFSADRMQVAPEYTAGEIHTQHEDKEINRTRDRRPGIAPADGRT